MNVGDLIVAACRHYPDRPAIQCGDRRYDYRELGRRVDALAAGLRSIGVGRGDRVALLMANRPELLEVMLASFRCGAIVLPLNARFVANEVVYHVNDAAAKVIIHGPEFAALIESTSGQVSSVEHIVSAGEARPAHDAATVGYDDLVLANSAAEWTPVDVDPDEVCWLFYTSGTTGQAKGAMLTHRNLEAIIIGFLADVVPLVAEDVTMHVAPLTHAAGFHALASLAKGARQVISDAQSFDPVKVLDVIQSERVTNMLMVPTQVARVIGVEGFDRYDLSSLTSVAYGGAPFPTPLLRTALEKLGPVLVQIYAQGESPMTVASLRKQEHCLDDEVHRVRIGSAGIPRTGTEVRIETATGTAAVGERGEILVRGPAVMAGYWGRPEESAKALAGGWLHTGDVGYLDEFGFLFVVDRMKDVIITGGSNVYAREVEDVLLGHPAVTSVAVIGLPDDDWGERVTAVVVSSVPVSAEELMNHCRERLASYKRPKGVVFVDALPINAYGKVLKRQLRAELGQ